MRGEGDVVVIEYGDYECPYCAQADVMVGGFRLTRVFRHFPVVSKHPRARILACAAEAAGLQGKFWEMHDSLFGDQGHLDIPHLWARAESFCLDMDRFEEDRRSKAVEERVAADFRAGIRAGVATTPTLFVDGDSFGGVPGPELLARLEHDAPRTGG